MKSNSPSNIRTGEYCLGQHHARQQAMRIGFNEIFHLLGILLLRVSVSVWFARPPLAAKVGGAAGGH